jgi:hypothetical protein
MEENLKNGHALDVDLRRDIVDVQNAVRPHFSMIRYVYLVWSEQQMELISN